MAQLIKQGDIFGRIGTGFGQGLAEQLPKEIERYRLSSGVEDLLNQNLTPAQFYSKALSIPGLIDRPEVIQNLQNFARQQYQINQASGQASASNQIPNVSSNGIPASPFSTQKIEIQPTQAQSTQDQIPVIPKQNESTPFSLTKSQGVQTALTPFIPPTEQQIDQAAKNLMASRPIEFQDYESARQRIIREVNAEKARYDANLEQREREQQVQSRVESEVKNAISPYASSIPDNMYKNIEQEAFKNVAKGMTEKQAAEVARKKAENIARDINTIQSWGGVGLITNTSSDLFRAVEAIRNDYKDPEDRRDLADIMVAQNNISPRFAYSLMFPVKENEKLNNQIKNIPFFKIDVVPNIAKKPKDRIESTKNLEDETLKISAQIFDNIDANTSPLSIAYELNKKGYDPNVFLSYALKNSKKLNGYQLDQLKKTKPLYHSALNDFWFQSFTGVE